MSAELISILIISLVVFISVGFIVYITIKKTNELAKILQEKQAALAVAYAFLKKIQEECKTIDFEKYIESNRAYFESISHKSYRETSSKPDYWLIEEKNKTENTQSSSFYNNKNIDGLYKKII